MKVNPDRDVLDEGTDLAVRYTSRRSGNVQEREGRVVEVLDRDEGEEDTLIVSVHSGETDSGYARLTVLCWYTDEEREPEVFTVAVDRTTGEPESKSHLGGLTGYAEADR